MRQPPRRVQGLLLLAAASLLTACPSLTTLHTARPIEPGRTQVAGAVGVYGFDDPQGGGHIGLLEGEIRYGFDERLDGGLRITGFSMYQADLNAALILSDDFVLSVDPTISTLPLGILMALAATRFMGVNANIMSLGGIAIAIGAMIDAAIV
ncbi:MAG: hypothetical protein ACE5F1_11115, partial [Planctomycetota bacterium]